MEENKEKDQRSESARTLGRLGGNSTLKKYGKDHYKKMIEKRWKKAREIQNEKLKQIADYKKTLT